MLSVRYRSFALLAQKLEMPENSLSFISTCWAQMISEPTFVQWNAVLPPFAVKTMLDVPAARPSWRDWKHEPLVASASKIQAEEMGSCIKDAD